MDPAMTWTAVAALAASLSALFAALYTWLTFRLVRSQTEPHVVVYVQHDQSRATILALLGGVEFADCDKFQAACRAPMRALVM